MLLAVLLYSTVPVDRVLPLATPFFPAGTRINPIDVDAKTGNWVVSAGPPYNDSQPHATTYPLPGNGPTPRLVYSTQEEADTAFRVYSRQYSAKKERIETAVTVGIGAVVLFWFIRRRAT